jgi:hypothetical protein
MKKITLIILLIMAKINASTAQNITFQNVKTETINVAGTFFIIERLVKIMLVYR